MNKLRLYFARPINTYGTPLEQELLALIAVKFPHHEVVNPADKIHADKVIELRKNDPKVNVMPYFKELAASCDLLVALPFGDCMLGAGVWVEAQKMLDKGGGVWYILPISHKILPSDIPQRLRLTVDETRARVYNPDRTIKPYV